MKHTWRKHEKSLYLPTEKPTQIEIPAFKYFTLEGEGNPNEAQFSEAVGALYAMSYGVKMLPKKGITPEGYFDYTVYPLEGFWKLKDEVVNHDDEQQEMDKNKLIYKIMIRQPDFVTEELATAVLEMVSKKKPNSNNSKIKFETIEEGLSVQMLHIGSYDTESSSFKMMKQFCDENNLVVSRDYHKEIYLSDPRKITVNANKTVLRYNIKQL